MTTVYPTGGGHCCVCSGACWHYSPATYCPRHMPQQPAWYWYPTTNTTWTFPVSVYVGRHRKGDPGAGQ